MASPSDEPSPINAIVNVGGRAPITVHQKPPRHDSNAHLWATTVELEEMLLQALPHCEEHTNIASKDDSAPFCLPTPQPTQDVVTCSPLSTLDLPLPVPFAEETREVRYGTLSSLSPIVCFITLNEHVEQNEHAISKNDGEATSSEWSDSHVSSSGATTTDTMHPENVQHESNEQLIAAPRAFCLLGSLWTGQYEGNYLQT